LNEEKKRIIQLEEKVASIRGNHLPSIYAILMFICLTVIEPIEIMNMTLTPTIGLISVYASVSLFYYKDVQKFSRTIIKKMIGLK